MKILVGISCVPDTTSKIEFVEGDTQFDTSGIQFIINPNDEFGLTRAVRFQQELGAQLTVVTVGEANVEPILRKCLAIGADKAIRIDSVAKDGFFVAQQLAALCKKNEYDLIFVGRESIDYNGGMVGGMLAALLEYPYVTNCVGMTLASNEANLQREIDGGTEMLKGQLPMVVGTQKGLVEESDLIIPNMRGIMQARQKPLDVLAAESFESATSDVSFKKPAPKGQVKLVDVDELISLLESEAKVI
ncbi:MAG: electron transfer flavoprotein subunit beta/FixA family protein [Flavobacteriaceae bacterium]|nr:electron transfer flavoprotein subunit beta/FixA family protein [Flavobacteriaceae bacterium]|tara:strand:- start:91 stop:828 length:738 start_codon:yes stop_codon:yes gene_type:complete